LRDFKVRVVAVLFLANPGLLKTVFAVSSVLILLLMMMGARGSVVG
jgi:hypothetical protein